MLTGVLEGGNGGLPVDPGNDLLGPPGLGCWLEKGVTGGVDPEGGGDSL